MEDIHIEGSKGVYIVPTVHFDAKTGICEISGESFLEETARFYNPLIEWIKNYVKDASHIQFIFKLTYFNTSTSKWILSILNELKMFEKNGGKAEIKWYYHEEDLDMRDDIQDYVVDTGLSIQLLPFE